MCNEYGGWQHVKGVIPSACLLANRGFAVAMVQYRGSEVASFPAQMLDTKAAVRFTKMNDELSSMDHIAPDSPEGGFIGGLNVLEHPELTEPTVVMNYIDTVREIPPVLIFHGTNDELVPFGQSCMLYDKLVQCKKEATFYAIENAHHGGREFWSDQVLDIIEAFIKREE